MRGAARGTAWSRDALWATAPRVLLRYPALLATVVSATALLALAAAAAPLFLSASSSEIVTASLGRPHITRYMAGITYRFAGLPLDPTSFEVSNPTSRGTTIRSPDLEDLDAAFGELAAANPVLAAPLAEVITEPITLTVDGRAGSQAARLFGAPGEADHVVRLTGREGDGVWVPELIAKDLGVGPGDTIELSDASRDGTRSVEVAVDGIYADIYLALPTDGYWLQWEQEFRLADIEHDVPPPPQPILAEREQVVAISRELGQTSATFSWQAPIADPTALSLEDVRTLDDYASEIVSFGFGRSRLGRTLECCGRWRTQVPDAQTWIVSSIDAVADDTELRIAATEGPAQVLEIAAVGVAIVVVAASGAFSVRSRRIEAEWLFARGTAPHVAAAKTAVETGLPSIAGGVLGYALAVLAVGAIGPDGTVDPSAYAAAAARTAIAVAAAVAIGSLVAGVAYLRIVDPHRRGLARIVGSVPWELGVIWLAYLAYRHLETGGALFADERLGVDRPSLALIAFPFLMLAGLAFLAARVALLGFRAIRTWTTGASPPVYLAARRLAAGGPLVVALIGAAGLCLGMFVHARLVSTSLDATLEAKSRVYVGSDVAAQIAYVSTAPDGYPFPITRVVQLGQAIHLPSGRALDLLAIDPATFAAAAYWNDSFGDASLAALMRAIRDAGRVDLPIVLAAANGLDVERVVFGSGTIPVDVVARVSAFPGLFSLRPLVVVDEQALLERLDGPNPLVHGWAELWARGDPEQALDALAKRDVPVYLEITAEEIQDVPAIAATIGTFVIVNVLGTAAAALVLVSMLAYARARQRSQFVAYALSARMGMTHADNRRALALELGSMIGIALAVGTTLAVAAAAVTVPLLDPLTSIPPGPLFVIPVGMIVVLATVVALLSWAGAEMVNRRARATNLGEVMRVAE